MYKINYIANIAHTKITKGRGINSNRDWEEAEKSMRKIYNITTVCMYYAEVKYMSSILGIRHQGWGLGWVGVVEIRGYSWQSLSERLMSIAVNIIPIGHHPADEVQGWLCTKPTRVSVYCSAYCMSLYSMYVHAYWCTGHLIKCHVYRYV